MLYYKALTLMQMNQFGLIYLALMQICNKRMKISVMKISIEF